MKRPRPDSLPLLVAALVLLALHPASAAYWNGHKSLRDLDGDGIPNVVDPDIDNDGIPNALDKNIDGGIAKTGPFAGKHVGDHIDNDNPEEEDADDDGLADDSLAEKDIDGDGKLDDDSLEDDIDGDGRKDDSTAERDTDGDGRDDDAADEDDIDGDGLDDDDDFEDDIDGDNKKDDADDDIDGDGKANDDSTELDTDGDGLTNDDPADKDDDGDSISDRNDDDDDNNGVKDIDDSGHHPEDGEQELQHDLDLLAAPGGSSARVTLKYLGTGAGSFVMDVRDAAVGSYNLVVGGVVRGAVVIEQLSNHTRGTLTFKTTSSGSGSLLLNFPVAEQLVEIRQGATVYYSGTVPALPPPSADGEIGEAQVHLSKAPNVPANADAVAVMEFTATGAIQIELEVTKIAIGAYDVSIGESVRGTITVAAGTNGTFGALKFTKAGDAGTVLMNFPVTGQTISITQGGTTFFTGQLAEAPTPP